MRLPLITSALLCAGLLIASPLVAQEPEPLEQSAQDTPAATEEDSGQLEPLAEELPEVTIFQRGEDTVTEYRISGKLYMVKVTPPHGRPYYLVDRKGNGQMIRDDNAGPMMSVPQWVITSW
jgi:hypothetical protein